MRVALDVSAVPARVAGAGRYVVELARRLPDVGVATTLVTRRDDADRWRDWSPRATLSSPVPNERALRLAYEMALLGTSEAARGVDVWHSPHYTMARRRARPTVVTIHDLTFFTDPQWHERAKVGFFRRAITYAAKNADVLVSVSATTSALLDDLFRGHAPVVVAPHGVDHDRFNTSSEGDDERRRAAHLSSDAPYVLFVGTLEPRKGLDVLLEAFGEFSRSFPDAELWIAGQAGWGLGDLDEDLRRHGVAARTRQLGFVDDAVLPALYRGARAVAYPSRGEGFGLPVLEALACGTRVITSARTVMEEVAGGAATLTPVGDAGALAGALEQVWRESEVERARAVAAGVARASLYTWDASVAQHQVAYEMARGAS